MVEARSIPRNPMHTRLDTLVDRPSSLFWIIIENGHPFLMALCKFGKQKHSRVILKNVPLTVGVYVKRWYNLPAQCVQLSWNCDWNPQRCQHLRPILCLDLLHVHSFSIAFCRSRGRVGAATAPTPYQNRNKNAMKRSRSRPWKRERQNAI